MADMLTKAERLRALVGNVKNWSFDVEPQFRLEKEDAKVLLEALQDYRRYCDMAHEGVFYDNQ